MKAYPLKLKSVLKDAIWGGNRLSEKYGLGDGDRRIAEAWTLTLRNDCENIIENGEFAGRTLGEYVRETGIDKLCGKAFAERNDTEFPLLVKLIDAKHPLSVQVHPDDKFAKVNGLGSGKTEMWYIVDAEPTSKLILGLKKGTDINGKEFAQVLQNGNISEYFDCKEVKKGEIYYIPAGLVHAIGGGVLIAEIQQNCDTTFRIYDYDRLGDDRKPRKLHLESAKKTIKTDFSKDTTLIKQYDDSNTGVPQLAVSSEYFSVSVLKFRNGGKHGFHGGKMAHIMCVDGCGSVDYIQNGTHLNISVCKGESVLVPAALGEYTVSSCEYADFIISGLPDG